VGGITETASAGPIALNATGATAGDITLTSGDDFTVAATGDASVNGANVYINTNASTNATNIATNGTTGTVTIGNESGKTSLNGVSDINFVGNSIVKIDVCDISNAKIKAMFTTPVVLVPAPGAGKMIVPVSITLVHNYAGAQFDANSAAITPSWYYSTSDTNTACTTTVTITNLLQTAGADRIYTLIPVAAGGAATLMDNCPVRLTLPANTGDPTGASATGTMRAVISYRIMPTGL
jgi:hypothetical protein